MFWGKKKDDTKALRDRNLQELMRAFPSIRRPNNDDTLFEILFNVGGVFSTLRIYVPFDFPTARPVIQVMGTAVHPWLDQYKRVANCSKLNEWTKTSSLVEVVQSILQALTSSSGAAAAPAPAATPIANPPGAYTVPASQMNPSSQATGAHPNNGSAGYGAAIASQVHARYQYPSLPNGNPTTTVVGTTSAVGASSNSSNAGVVVGTMSASGASSSQAFQPPPIPTAYGITPVAPRPMMNPSTIPSSSNVSVTTPSPSSATSPTAQSVQPNPSAASPRGSSASLTPLIRGTGKPETCPMPDIPSSFPELRSLSEEQLDNMLNTAPAFKAYLASFPDVNNLKKRRETLRKTNLDQATSTLQKEDEADQMRAEIEALKSELRAATEQYRAAVQLSSRTHAFNREEIMKQLVAKRDELDMRSEDIASKFVSGEVTAVESITKLYLEDRKAYHALNVRLELLKTSS